ncbi:hypothetical protein ACN42_g3899 [Penicillium freii]|uniref:Uncharacterized protein n=1 Tax=Penicillium freii TaxID=48697 RepID=A0A101MME0_PENFR|nr:hypothetical protein ACN42_g3899 [Penicillium freii]
MADPIQLANAAMSVSHNYYPPTILLPQYVDNESSAISIIIQFGFLWAAVLGIAMVIISHVRPTASQSDKLAFVWMCLSEFYILCSPLLNETDLQA